MTPKSHFEVGDLFTVPLGNDWLGFGQIVDSWGESGGHFYFAIFEGKYSREATPNLDAVLARPVAILALSMDPLLQHGHWQVVGNRPVSDDLPWPAYKEGVTPPGTFEVVDHSGHLRRRATARDIEQLNFRSVVAPIRLEKAFQALNGLGDWNPAFDSLRPVSNEMTSAYVFSH